MKSKFIKAFLTIISILLVSEVFFVATCLSITERYQRITNTLVYEYQLAEKASNLVNSFYDLIQYSNDKKRTQAFKDNLTSLQDLLAKLDKDLANTSSWTVYVGTKNTVNTVIGHVNKGISDISAGNFSEVTNDYLRAANDNVFIRENTSNLVLKELENAEEILMSLGRTKFWGLMISFLLLIATLVGSLLYALSFSKKFTDPLARLAQYSQKLSSGSVTEKLDNDLLAGKDDVAVLAKSLNAIAFSLQNNDQKMKDKDDQLAKAQKNMVDLGLQIDSLREGTETPKAPPDEATKK